jgi:hypothetical protein
MRDAVKVQGSAQQPFLQRDHHWSGLVTPKRLRNIVSAPQSPPPRESPPGPHFKAPQSAAASFVRREFKRHLCVVDSLDKQMQNEKELIHLASAGVGGLLLQVYCIFSG